MKDGTGEFDWDAEEQGIILGGFYYGYLVTQVASFFINFSDKALGVSKHKQGPIPDSWRLLSREVWRKVGDGLRTADHRRLHPAHAHLRQGWQGSTHRRQGD